MKEMILNFARSLNVRNRFYRRLQDKARVLDLGCGTGDNGMILKTFHPSIELYGIDILPDTAIPSFYTYKAIDLDKGALPFPDEYFDAVIFIHVIEHLHSPLQLGKEINRVMKKGAQIYVETPNWATLFVPSFGFHRDQHHPFNFYDDPTHIKPWSKHGLYEFLFKSCNLNVTNVGSTRIWLRIPFDFFGILLGILQRDRARIVYSFWNLYGWCIFGIGEKN